MKKIINNFGKFIKEQNIVGAGIGMIIALASKDYINVFIESLISPIINQLLALIGFDPDGATITIPGTIMTFGIGQLISATITFVVIMFVAYIILKGNDRLFADKDETSSALTKDQELLEDIRDILKEKQNN